MRVSQRARRDRQRQAFTLIELLVVVAIVGLLLAILIPSLRAAREQSKRTVCQSNLRQLATGWRTYLDAHGGRFLKGVNSNVNYGGRQGTLAGFGGPIDEDPGTSPPPVPKPLNAQLSLPVMVDHAAEVFHCPADRGGGVVQPTHFKVNGTSYLTNLLLVGPTQMNVLPNDPCAAVWTEMNLLNRLAKTNESQLSNTSKLVLMGDAGWLNTWWFSDTQRIEWHGKPATHNLAFMDGHADFVLVRKRMHVTSTYTVNPFFDLADTFGACQQEAQTP